MWYSLASIAGMATTFFPIFFVSCYGISLFKLFRKRNSSYAWGKFYMLPVLCRIQAVYNLSQNMNRSSVRNLTHLVTILMQTWRKHYIYLLEDFPDIYDTTALHKFLIVPNFTLSKYCFILTQNIVLYWLKILFYTDCNTSRRPIILSTTLWKLVLANLFLHTFSHKLKQAVQARSQKAGRTQSLQYICKFVHNFTTVRTWQLPMDFGSSLLTRIFTYSLFHRSINVLLLISCLTLAND